jgi:hypothetical protein
MWMYDVETLGIESNSVILSMALIYFNPEEKPTFKQLVDNAFFVKLNAKDQIERLGRKVTKSTLEWWNEQNVFTRGMSFTVSPDDVTAEDALDQMREFVVNQITKTPDAANCTVWARGNLDQMCLGSLENKLDRGPIFHFGRWRDVRTAVDIFTGSKNGYCNVDHAEFNRDDVIKHNPIHDCAYDAMMLMYGK